LKYWNRYLKILVKTCSKLLKHVQACLNYSAVVASLTIEALEQLCENFGVTDPSLDGEEGILKFLVADGDKTIGDGLGDI